MGQIGLDLHRFPNVPQQTLFLLLKDRNIVNTMFEEDTILLTLLHPTLLDVFSSITPVLLHVFFPVQVRELDPFG